MIVFFRVLLNSFFFFLFFSFFVFLFSINIYLNNCYLIKCTKQQEKYRVSREKIVHLILIIWINSVNFYHFLQFTVGKPDLITTLLFSKQRFHEFFLFCVFTRVASIYANLLKQKRRVQLPHDTNMASMTSCEDTYYFPTCK